MGINEMGMRLTTLSTVIIRSSVKMLDTNEQAQTQMRLLHKKGALLEWEETWWEEEDIELK